MTATGRRAGILAAAAFLAAAVPATASAHASLVRSAPANGETVRGAPVRLALGFDEAVSAALSRVTLVGARSGPVAPVAVSADGPAGLSVRVPALRRDIYRLEWHTVATDDLHATGGAVVFGVDTPVPGAVARAVTRAPGPNPLEVALRWIDLAAVAVLLGALGVVLVVVPRAERRGALEVERVRVALVRLAAGGAETALCSGVALLAVQLGSVGGPARLPGILARTVYGHAWIARELSLALLVALLATLGPARSERRLRAAAALLPVVVASLAVVGHAAAIRGTASAATALLAVHLAAGCAWVGGVAALVAAVAILVRRGDAASARTLALAFGEPAGWCVAVLALTGLALLGVHVRSLDALVGTAYGWSLVAKTSLLALAGALALAATLELRLRRGGRSRLGWPRFEAAVLLSVLLTAALLAAQAPARGPVPTPAPTLVPAAAASTDARDLVVRLAVEPGRPGTNFVTASVYDTRRPPPAPIRRVVLHVRRPGRGAPRTLELVPAGGREWRGVARLPLGSGRLDVTIDRPGLPPTRTSLPWSTRRGSGPAAPVPSPGFAARSLDSLLRPVVAAATVLLLLAALARLVAVRPWSARPLRPRELEQ